LKESQEVEYNNGTISFAIKGENITYANIHYLVWQEPVTTYYIKVRTPLDYTNTCLLFALFGFIGFFFALMLKHNDKTSGYGLELPSNAIEKQVENEPGK